MEQIIVVSYYTNGESKPVISFYSQDIANRWISQRKHPGKYGVDVVSLCSSSSEAR